MGIAYNTSVVRDGLVVYLDAANPKSYPGTGTTWFDLSQYKNNMTLVNGITYSTDNKGILIFDGIDDHIKKTTIEGDSLDLRNNFTLSLWFNANSLPVGNIDSSLYYLVSKNSTLGSADNQYSMLVNSSTFRCSISGIFAPTTVNYTFNNNTWYNAVLTFNGSTARIYINQQKILEHTQVYNALFFKPNLSIGRRSTSADGVSGSLFFNGEINEFKIYNRPLSEAEVKYNFEGTRGRYGI